MRIFVGNLARDVTEAELQEAFAEFGHVSSVAILKDRETGEPRGFGFVEMPADAEAKLALAGLSGRSLKGRPLRVDEARPRDDRGPAGGQRAPMGSRSNGFNGRSYDREAPRPPARAVEREPERGSNRDSDRAPERRSGWGTDRAPERDDSRRQPRGDRDTWEDRRRAPRDDWSPPPLPTGDDWSSPPRGVDDDGPSTRGNRNSRATGKRGRDDPDGGDRSGKWGRSGGRRGRRSRYEEDDESW